MSTIAENLALLADTKTKIKASIEAKGVTVGNAPFADYPAKIIQISGGGSSDTEKITGVIVNVDPSIDATNSYIYMDVEFSKGRVTAFGTVSVRKGNTEKPSRLLSGLSLYGYLSDYSGATLKCYSTVQDGEDESINVSASVTVPRSGTLTITLK